MKKILPTPPKSSKFSKPSKKSNFEAFDDLPKKGSAEWIRRYREGEKEWQQRLLEVHRNGYSNTLVDKVFLTVNL